MNTTPEMLASAIDYMAENPKGGKMAAIAYRDCARLIRRKLAAVALPETTDSVREAVVIAIGAEMRRQEESELFDQCGWNMTAIAEAAISATRASLMSETKEG